MEQIDQAMMAKEIVRKAEKRVMESIFPNCQQSPFFIYSLHQLNIFLVQPNSSKCLSSAFHAWKKIPNDNQINILNNLEKFYATYPNVAYGIEFLKECEFYNVCKKDWAERTVLSHWLQEIKDFIEYDEYMKLIEFEIII